MLCECEQLDTRSSFAKAKSLLGDDPRWTALDSKDRNVAFDDAEDEMKRVDKARRAARKERAVEEKAAFLACLAEHGVGAEMDVDDAGALPALRDDARWASLEDAQRVELFEEHQDALAKVARKAAKGAFAVLLGELRDEGAIGRKTKWKEAAERVKQDERYAALKKASADAPTKAYERFVDELQEAHAASVAHAKALAAKCASLTSTSSYDDFVAALEAAAAEPAPGDSEGLGTVRAELREALGAAKTLRADMKADEAELEAGGGALSDDGGDAKEEEGPTCRALGTADALRAAHEATVERLAAAEAVASKSSKREKRKFREMLEGARDMALSGTSYGEWRNVREVLSSHTAFEGVPSEAEREKMWGAYCEELREEEAEQLAKKGRKEPARDEKERGKEKAKGEGGEKEKEAKKAKKGGKDREKERRAREKERERERAKKKKGKGGKRRAPSGSYSYDSYSYDSESDDRRRGKKSKKERR
jgi:hypothetical protein